MKRLRLLVCGFGLIPIVGWVVSLGLSLILNGSAFSWSPIAYAPLLVITFPLRGLYGYLIEVMGRESHLGTFIFAVASCCIYTGAAVVITAPLWISKIKQSLGSKGKKETI